MLDSIKPTQVSVHNPMFGPRNLGHYFGSMKDLVRSQYDYNSIVIIDDLAATFMNPRDFKNVQNRSFFLVQDFVNSGYDINVNNIILTSQLGGAIMQLVLLFTSFVDHKYCHHLFTNSFLGGLKAYQRKEIGLKSQPSILEHIYPQFGMPAISLGLDVELFQGGEEILGYTYIMDEIVGQIKQKTGLFLHSPVFEPSKNVAVLGIDGKYMFQHNCIYLSDSEDKIREQVATITDIRVLVDWFVSLGYQTLAAEMADKSNLDYGKICMSEVLVKELGSFRENTLMNSQIIDILERSKSRVEMKLQEKIEELRAVLSISNLKI